MRNKLFTLIVLSSMALALTSCFTSRSKYGCPATAYSYKKGKF